MTPKEAAAMLDGVEYVHPLEAKLREMEKVLENEGLVVAYGASDDLLEFFGAISDEVGAWDGTTVPIDADGVLKSKCGEGSECPYFAGKLKSAEKVTAEWCPKGVEGDPTWLIKTAIPHEQFKIMEDGAVFCIGIVFKVDDIGKIRTP